MRKSPQDRVRDYVVEQFKGQPVLLNNSLKKDDDTVDIFGFMGLIVLVKKVGNYIHYKPVYKNQ